MAAARANGTRAKRAPIALVGAAIAVAVVFAAPALYIVWRTVDLGADLGDLLSEAGSPLWRTVQLALLTGISTAILGTGLAWLLVRTDIPLARFWRVLAPLPLVFPSFIGAAAFIAAIGPDGVLRDVLELVGYHPPRRFRGLGASWLVMTLFTYPYVYLPVAARLAALPPSVEESARLLGDNTRRLFVRVILPTLRPSIAGGALLVFLYSLSEFGAVQLLGYDTLTRVIYATRLVDRAQSFAAAALLLVLAGVAVTIERRIQGRAVAALRTTSRRARPVPLGRWRLPAVLGAATVAGLALAVPVATLVRWAWTGIANSTDPGARLSHDLSALGDPAWTTAGLSVAAGAVAVAVVFPVALLAVRYRSAASGPATLSIVAGLAIPGLVIALSLAFWSLNLSQLSWLYQTVPLLVTAYVLHFGCQAMRAAEVAIGAVPDRLRESAQLLGAGPVRRALTIDLPLMRPGLLAGGGLVFLSTVKELPATLLLAPTGLETLTTKVWGAFEDGFLSEAGLASVALVVVSGVLTWLLVLRQAPQHLR